MPPGKQRTSTRTGTCRPGAATRSHSRGAPRDLPRCKPRRSFWRSCVDGQAPVAPQEAVRSHMFLAPRDSDIVVANPCPTASSATMTRAQDPNVGYDIVPRRKNNYPRMNGEFADLRKAIGDFILDDNNKLRVDKNTIFFLQGSCFAENLHAELKASGYPCIYNQVIEALNSPLANLLQFQAMARDHNAPVTAQFKQANVFVLTIGVAPCWYLRATGQFVLQ